jgi:rubrerythrin
MSNKQPEEILEDLDNTAPCDQVLYDCDNCRESFYAPEGEFFCPFCGEPDLEEV